MEKPFKKICNHSTQKKMLYIRYIYWTDIKKTNEMSINTIQLEEINTDEFLINKKG